MPPLGPASSLRPAKWTTQGRVGANHASRVTRRRGTANEKFLENTVLFFRAETWPSLKIADAPNSSARMFLTLFPPQREL